MGQTHAVVIGGSLAGMCAARVLGDFFNKVTVVERDQYPQDVADRAGVPQGRGIHNLLIRGRREYERHFPGFDQLMLERGAHESELGVDQAVLTPIGWMPPRRTFMLPSLFGSRALIESTVRDLFRKLPRIEVIQRAEVVAVKATRNGEFRCAGVTGRFKEGGGTFELDADLVVDASGRTSKSADWLKSIGVEPPAETVIEPFGGYACRWFKLRAEAQWPNDWWWRNGAWLLNDPVRGYALVRYENERWMLMQFGLNQLYPPHQEDAFMAVPGQLCSPIIAQMLALMEPVSPLYAHRGLTNRWRHYDTWKRGLKGFIATADAACIFNPIFAQGMTAAAVSASVMRRIVEERALNDPQFESRFFTAQARFQREPWIQAVSTDVVLPGTAGDRSRALRLFDWYRRGVNLAARDPSVFRTLVEVINLLKPISALFAPPILMRVAITKAVLAAARLVGRSLIRPPTLMPPPMPASDPETLMPATSTSSSEQQGAEL